MSENLAHAPYNFVPFAAKPFSRYVDSRELPRHDLLDETLKSGLIHVSFTAETPVFVSDGKKEDPHFIKNAAGSYVLPGSTIRGLVRENMQVLGFGAVVPDWDFDNRTFLYRAVGDKSQDPRKGQYNTVLGGDNNKQTADRVNAGYLYGENGKYFIHPAIKPVGCRSNFYRLERESKLVPGAYRDKYAFHEKCWYQANGENITALSLELKDGYSEGQLLSSGKMQKQKRLYIFPSADAAADEIPISDRDRRAYETDFEAKENQLSKEMKSELRLDPRVSGKPVFYLQYEGRVCWGQTQYLRVQYEHATADGLPDGQKDSNSPVLDYPNALLGFSVKDTDGKLLSYRSRISFSDLAACGQPRESEPFRMILGGPKASYYKGYLMDGNNYNDPDFQLRGYKQYWPKKETDAPRTNGDNKNAKILSCLRPLPAGTRFEGTLRFENLAEDELGLLLLCLDLGKDRYQMLGMGKPYGFGRMSVRLSGLEFLTPASLYGTELVPQTKMCRGEELEKERGRLVAAYKSYIEEKRLHNKRKYDDQPAIKDFLFLHELQNAKDIGTSFSYMELAEYKSTNLLPTTDELRKKAMQVQAKPQTVESTDKTEFSIENALKELNSKFGGADTNSTGKGRRRK